MSYAPISAGRLKSFVERIEKLEEERKAIGGDIRDVYTEAKGVGYDVKAIRKIVALRRQDPNDRAEEEAILDTYMHALGMGGFDHEAQADQRAEQMLDEVRRCLKLSNDGQPPRIDAIKRELGCSAGKASKIRKLCAEQLAAVSFSSDSRGDENETPHDAATGEVVDMGNPTSNPEAEIPASDGAEPDGSRATAKLAVDPDFKTEAERLFAGGRVSVEFHAEPGSLVDRIGAALERIAPGQVQRNVPVGVAEDDLSIPENLRPHLTRAGA